MSDESSTGLAVGVVVGGVAVVGFGAWLLRQHSLAEKLRVATLLNSVRLGAFEDKTEPVLGCKAWLLEPGVEFSNDEGRSWRTVVTICDDPEAADGIIINARNDDGDVDTWRPNSREHVLLERHWKG